MYNEGFHPDVLKPNLTELNLESLNFKDSLRRELKTPGHVETQSVARTHIHRNGNEMMFSCKRTRLENTKIGELLDEFLDMNLETLDGIKILEGTLRFNYQSQDKEQVTTSITKKKQILNSRDEKYLGVGREVYLRMLSYIQSSADKSKQELTHLVRKKPNGISGESWDNTFSELLENQGYEKSEDDDVVEWKKTYQPTNLL